MEILLVPMLAPRGASASSSSSGCTSPSRGAPRRKPPRGRCGRVRHLCAFRRHDADQRPPSGPKIGRPRTQRRSPRARQWGQAAQAWAARSRSGRFHVPRALRARPPLFFAWARVVAQEVRRRLCASGEPPPFRDASRPFEVRAVWRGSIPCGLLDRYRDLLRLWNCIIPALRPDTPREAGHTPHLLGAKVHVCRAAGRGGHKEAGVKRQAGPILTPQLDHPRHRAFEPCL